MIKLYKQTFSIIQYSDIRIIVEYEMIMRNWNQLQLSEATHGKVHNSVISKLLSGKKISDDNVIALLLTLGYEFA